MKRNKTTIFAAIVLMTLSVFACQKEVTPLTDVNTVSQKATTYVPATEITIKALNRTGIYTNGGSTTITVSQLPVNADPNYVISIVSGGDCATLTNNVLKAVKNGVIRIKAVTANGAHWDSCAVIIANQSLTTMAPLETALYVSPSGNDGNPGTIDKPYKSIEKAYSVAGPGKLFYFRGGNYRPNNPNLQVPINLIKGINGTAGNLIRFWAYPGEKPVIDLSTVKFSGGTIYGLYFTGNYWHWKGFEVSGLPNNPWLYTHAAFIARDCNYCIFENFNVHDNNGLGFTLGNNSTGNLILNSDAYNNADPGTSTDPYGNADGFHIGVTANSGAVNTVRGCRAWDNSDDGYDCYNNEGMVVFENCWSFKNGYRPNSLIAAGDGVGFKLGGSLGSYTNIHRSLTNCIATLNKLTGFDLNDGIFAVSLSRCISYKNGNHGIYLNKYSETNQISNCISFSNGSGYNALITAQSTIANCSWQISGFSSSNFVSVDDSQLNRARNSDNTLPSISFLQLSSSSSYQYK